MFMKSRKRLSGVIAACLLIALAAAVARTQGKSQSPAKTMEGTWKVTVTPGPAPVPRPPTFEALVTYVPGGGLVESDNLGVPGSIAGTGQGAWAHAGARQFRITFTKYLFSTQGLSQGSGRITEKISLNAGGDEYTGQGEMEILSPAGGVTFTVLLTTHAVRVLAEEP
jgi:hypothetical protein